MKQTIKVLLFAMIALSLCTCEREDSGNEFPDVTFLGVLIREGVDANRDGKISSAEAEAVRTLDISYSSIEDVTGIGAFTNLDTLICYYNLLTSLDVSHNTNLVYLDCLDNKLTSLDLSKNTALTTLLCNSNMLTYLDVSNNTRLNHIDCSSNLFVTLDFSKNTRLNDLSIRYMHSLHKVCVYEIPSLVDSEGSIHAYLSTDCGKK
jgi:Leucine-rich repeat (LRR) protein